MNELTRTADRNRAQDRDSDLGPDSRPTTFQRIGSEISEIYVQLTTAGYLCIHYSKFVVKKSDGR